MSIVLGKREMAYDTKGEHNATLCITLDWSSGNPGRAPGVTAQWLDDAGQAILMTEAAIEGRRAAGRSRADRDAMRARMEVLLIAREVYRPLELPCENRLRSSRRRRHAPAKSDPARERSLRGASSGGQ
jgi:hypothetical protein